MRKLLSTLLAFFALTASAAAMPVAMPVTFWSASAYHANIVTYTSGPATLTRSGALTGTVDTETFVFADYIVPSAHDVSFGVQLFTFYAGTTTRIAIGIDSTGHITAQGFGLTSGNKRLDLTSSTVLSAATPYAILLSIDLTNSSNRALYINDVLDTTTWTTYVNNTLSFGTIDTYVVGNITGGGANYTGDMADFYWVENNTFLDLSVTANRRLFFSATNKPANKGATGSVPTGTAPQTFFPNPAASYNTNASGNGNFISNGVFTNNGTT